MAKEAKELRAKQTEEDAYLVRKVHSQEERARKKVGDLNESKIEDLTDEIDEEPEPQLKRASRHETRVVDMEMSNEEFFVGN